MHNLHFFIFRREITMARDQKTAVLGSGHNYILPYTGTIPTPAQIVAQCVPEKRFGTTYSGATLTYTVETHEESDDMGFVVANILTKEEVKLKLGAFSWNLDMLTKLASTARVVDDGALRVARLGGLDNDSGANHLVVFEHVDKKQGNMYIVIVGSNSNGLSMAFAKDNVTKLEPEFKAVPQDDDGTLVMIIEAPAPAQNAPGENNQDGN